MKKYKSKLNLKISDHIGALALWMIAIVFTLGYFCGYPIPTLVS